jgi:hypothetical protein
MVTEIKTMPPEEPTSPPTTIIQDEELAESETAASYITSEVRTVLFFLSSFILIC